MEISSSISHKTFQNSLTSTFNQLMQSCKSSQINFSTTFLGFNNLGLIDQNRKRTIPLQINKNNNLSQQQYNNKCYLEKLFKKAKRKNQSNTIRKTDLGDAENIFNAHQLEVLKTIDQHTKSSIKYKNIKNISLNQDNIKYLEEILPLKSNTIGIEDTQKQIQINMQWGGLIRQQKKNKQKSKIINFYKRQLPNCRNISKSPSLNIDQFKLQTIHQENQQRNSQRSDFGKSKIKQFNQTHAIYQDIQPKNINKKQILAKFQQQLRVKLDNCKKTTYLTKERVQALYECQLLRGAKKILGRRQYQNIFIVLDKQNKPINQKNKPVNSQIPKQNYARNQIEQILRINYNRIKLEKKRVVEKLKC